MTKKYHKLLLINIISILLIVISLWYFLFSTKYISGRVTQFCNGVEVPLENSLVKIYTDNKVLSVTFTSKEGYYFFEESYLKNNKEYYLTSYYLTTSDMNQSGVRLITNEYRNFNIKIIDCFVGE